MSFEKEIDSPRNWENGRLRNKINSARNGDHSASRELLRIAATQYREYDDIEPDLRRYLESILLNLAGAPVDDFGRVLNILPKRNSAHRPQNMTRVMSMLWAWKVASTNPKIDPGDDANLKVYAKKISKNETISNDHEQLKEWFVEYSESIRFVRFSTTADTYQLAAKLFNHSLIEAQAEGRRKGERTIKGAGIKAAVTRAKRLAKLNGLSLQPSTEKITDIEIVSVDAH